MAAGFRCSAPMRPGLLYSAQNESCLCKGVTKQMDIHLKETIPKVFQPIHKAVQNEGIKEVVAKGVGQVQLPVAGVGFAKLRHPDRHAVVLRKVAGTRNSGVTRVLGHRCASVTPHGFADGMYLFAYRTEDPLFRPDAGKLKSLKLPSAASVSLLVRGAGPVRRPRGGAQRGAEHFPRRQLQFDFKKF